MRLVPISADRIDEAWAIIKPYAQQMADRFPDDWPLSEIQREAREGTLLLWLVWSDEERQHFGVVGTFVLVKPSGKRVLEVAIAAGVDHGQWVHCITQLEDDARRRDCSSMLIRGRAGWARSLKDYRVEKDVLLTKELA